MGDLVFIAFSTGQKAEEVRQKVFSLPRDYLIELGDAVAVVKNEEDEIKLNQMMNLTAAGAGSGGLWGTRIGFIFLMPLVGTAIGAASGPRGGKLSDIGINDRFMKDAAAALRPNSTCLLLLVRKMTTDKVLADLKGIGGTLVAPHSTKPKKDNGAPPSNSTPKPSRTVEIDFPPFIRVELLPDATYDAVICRHLVWTLIDPAKAVERTHFKSALRLPALELMLSHAGFTAARRLPVSAIKRRQFATANLSERMRLIGAAGRTFALSVSRP